MSPATRLASLMLKSPGSALIIAMEAPFLRKNAVPVIGALLGVWQKMNALSISKCWKSKSVWLIETLCRTQSLSII
jgi:hypothetical protein